MASGAGAVVAARIQHQPAVEHRQAGEERRRLGPQGCGNRLGTAGPGSLGDGGRGGRGFRRRGGSVGRGGRRLGRGRGSKRLAHKRIQGIRRSGRRFHALFFQRCRRRGRGRLAALERHRPGFLLADACREHVLAIDHPYLTVGVERYGRVAAAVGVEPRHPFLDPRMMAFCAALPEEQKLRQGWPKFILRQAMASRLPEAVRWRRGKEHLGSAFTMAYMGGLPSAEQDGFDKTAIFRTISKYVNVANLYYAGFETLQGACCDDIYDVVHLAVWLSRRESRQGIGK